ncbi:MAG TPA: GDYXXLXY domain-containing protein [Blastocatellia bacterium]|nr:GDYXXLXY domain-containing protein [Blastocatellia bacterium]
MSERASFIAFVAAIVVQVLILVGVPARKAITLATGKSAVLKVQPVDPYSILSGYYVTLSFEISQVRTFPDAPEFSDGESCYAVIERGEDGIWKPVSLEHELPENLPENRAAVLGRVNYGRIEYGIEQFFIPETKRDAVADDLRANRDNARVEIRIDGGGHAALERLRIEDRVYE